MCHTPLAVPLAVPLLRALGRAGGTRAPRPQLIEAPRPHCGSPCVSSKTAAPARAPGLCDCRVIDRFRASAAARTHYIWWCALGHHNLFDAHAFWYRCARFGTLPTFGLILSDQTPWACILVSGESTLLFARFAAGLFLLFGSPSRCQYPHFARRSYGGASMGNRQWTEIPGIR